MTIKPMAMRDALLTRICDTMATDPSIFLVTADFGSPIIDRVRADHADRFVNVGVAEQNLINVSAGLALEGFNVFAYAIAPFITMRCFEQTRVNLCLLSQVRTMSVNLVGVGAGYSYVVSGPTHQCYEDISLMRTLPTVQVLSPSEHATAAELFDLCRRPGIRYLRLDAQILPILEGGSMQPFGMRRLAGTTGRVALVSTGFMTHTALDVARDLVASGIDCTVDDLVDITGFDADELTSRLAGAELVVSLEEGFTGRGGVDSVIQNLIRERGLSPRFLPLGVPPSYGFELGTRAELHHEAGLSHSECAKRIAASLEA